ncbi:class I SAM-dependent methyltransferase [Bradyrhizobium sp. CCBAU 11434]|uniref:class I SAM-dependent methyltransferase n=1 Tax=Bradyrhizobium sp. CCBAU 11434 TaxID=1630885 RepID=UPI002305B581|nr:class I SAM-dependent methyltransferase [Bradyrhizobium sp. CCBAU 11434]
MSNEFASQSKSYLARSEIHTQWQNDYLNADMDRFYDLAFAEILRRLKPQPQDKLLDAGCGYCYHTERLARGGCAITSVDFSEAALAIASKTISRAGLDHQVKLQQADLTRLVFENDFFDFVVSWGVIMHIPEMEKALAELARVLKPGGVLVLCENNLYSLDVQIRERVVGWIKKLVGRKMPHIEMTPRGSEAWFTEDGGGLMVRKTNMEFLTRFLQEKGLRLEARIAGQFSEAYTNVPVRLLKKPLFRLNEFYFQHMPWPALAMGNILFFRKD